MRKLLSFEILSSCIVVLIICSAGIYVWQHSKVTILQKQLHNANSRIQTTQSSLDKENSNLTNELSEARKSAQTQSQDYIAGSQCQDSQLELTDENKLSGGYAGGGEIFSFENVSSVQCTLNGYPGFLALDSEGNVKPDGPVADEAITIDGIKVTSNNITLNSQDKAYFLASGWSNMMAEGPPFDTAIIESTPPGASLPLVISDTSISMYEAQNINVSPLFNQQELNKLVSE